MSEYNEKFLFKKSEVAELFNVSVNSVAGWKVEPVKDIKPATFYLPEVIKYKMESYRTVTLDFNTERTRKEKELADKLEMQNEEFRKSLISVSDVERIWGDIADNVKSKMLGITNQVSKVLSQNCTVTIPFEDVKRIENAFDGQLKSALSELSRTGR